MDLIDRIRGCLLGGAVGDALGAPVEFLSLREIRARFGRDGPREFAPVYGRLGAVTDDTQMTMFTVEGLIRSAVRAAERGVCHPPSVVHNAYLRWLATQGQTSDHELFDEERDGWLYGVRDLHNLRAPGNSCMGGLRRRDIGTVEDPANNSKGCGTVMRIAPVGFWPEDFFRLGRDIGALTHGHPTGYLAAGYLATLIHAISEGQVLREAAATAYAELVAVRGSEETLEAAQAALDLARADQAPTPEGVESLGAGWIAEEALAISLYCALSDADFETAVRVAVTHSGDSDSTGCITGAILGARDGPDVIPRPWLEAVEFRDELETLAADYARVLTEGDEEQLVDDLGERYPGW